MKQPLSYPVFGSLSVFCRALNSKAFPSSLDTIAFIPLHPSAFSRESFCRAYSTRSSCAEVGLSFGVSFCQRNSQPMLVQTVWAFCTFRFRMVTLGNSLLVIQKRRLWICVVTKCLFHITKQSDHFALPELHSPPRGNTAGFIKGCS